LNVSEIYSRPPFQAPFPAAGAKPALPLIATLAPHTSSPDLTEVSSSSASSSPQSQKASEVPTAAGGPFAPPGGATAPVASPPFLVTAATSTTTLTQTFDLGDPTQFLFLYDLDELTVSGDANDAQRQQLAQLEHDFRAVIGPDQAHFSDAATAPLPQLLRRFGPVFAAWSAKARGVSPP